MTPYAKFLATDETAVLPTTVVLMILYTLLIVWCFREMLKSIGRNNSYLKRAGRGNTSKETSACQFCVILACCALSCFTTVVLKVRMCSVTLLCCVLSATHVLVRRYHYDSVYAKESLRAASEIAHVLLLTVVVKSWTKLSIKLNHAVHRKGMAFTQRILLKVHYVAYLYFVLRVLEMVFRIPPLVDDAEGVNLVFRFAAFCFLGLIGASIISLLVQTLRGLRGLIAKQKAGDTLKRRIRRLSTWLLFSISLALLYLVLWIVGTLMRNNVDKDVDPLAYFAAYAPLGFVEYFTILCLWVPIFLTDEKGWCGLPLPCLHRTRSSRPALKSVAWAGQERSTGSVTLKRSNLAFRTKSTAKTGKLRSKSSFTPRDHAIELVVPKETDGEEISFERVGETRPNGGTSPTSRRGIHRSQTAVSDKRRPKLRRSSSKKGLKRLHSSYEMPPVFGMNMQDLSDIDPSRLMGMDGDEPAETDSALGDVSSSVEGERREFLKTIPIFSHLTETQFEMLARCAKPRLYPAHSVIVRQGEVGTDVYIIKKGRVYVSVKDTRSSQSMRNSISKNADCEEKGQSSGQAMPPGDDTAVDTISTQSISLQEDIAIETDSVPKIRSEPLASGDEKVKRDSFPRSQSFTWGFNGATVTAKMGCGDVYGELAVFSGEGALRTATCTAMTETECLAVSGDSLQDIYSHGSKTSGANNAKENISIQWSSRADAVMLAKYCHDVAICMGAIMQMMAASKLDDSAAADVGEIKNEQAGALASPDIEPQPLSTAGEKEGQVVEISKTNIAAFGAKTSDGDRKKSHEGSGLPPRIATRDKGESLSASRINRKKAEMKKGMKTSGSSRQIFVSKTKSVTSPQHARSSPENNARSLNADDPHQDAGNEYAPDFLLENITTPDLAVRRESECAASKENEMGGHSSENDEVFRQDHSIHWVKLRQASGRVRSVMSAINALKVAKKTRQALLDSSTDS